MQRMLNYSVLVILCGIMGCKQSLTPEEYISWTETNDELSSEQAMGDAVYDFRMKPADYMISRESAGRPLQMDTVENRREELSDMLYFNLKIYPKNGHADLLRKDGPDMGLYQQRIYYYSFTFQHDISLVSDGDTLPCLLYHYIHDHGLSPEMDFTMAFERPTTNADFMIVVQDAVMNTGKLTFPFTGDILTNLPELKLSSL